MYCDRSVYYQKAIKATARRLKINTNLLWLFLLFGRLVFLTNKQCANVCVCQTGHYNLSQLKHITNFNQNTGVHRAINVILCKCFNTY